MFKLAVFFALVAAAFAAPQYLLGSPYYSGLSAYSNLAYSSPLSLHANTLAYSAAAPALTYSAHAPALTYSAHAPALAYSAPAPAVAYSAPAPYAYQTAPAVSYAAEPVEQHGYKIAY